MSLEPQQIRNAIVGSLLGTAAGDAMGLSCEGMSRQRQAKLLSDLEKPRFLFGCGMISDDTEHACMAAQALIVSGGDAEEFERRFAWKLRWWLLGLPGGIGLATLKAAVKLWMGFPPSRSGVRSAGNGPSMRSAIIGTACAGDLERLVELIRRETRLTHTDPKAFHGALAVALAARTSALGRAAGAFVDDYLKELTARLEGDGGEFLDLAARAAGSARSGETALQFMKTLGLENGVTGYTLHTVPVVLQIWFRRPGDYREGVQEIIRCGGDTDTTAAILGGIVGAAVGEQGIPDAWLSAVCDWPRSVDWMRRVGERLAEAVVSAKPGEAEPLPLAATMARNLFFIVVVLFHGFRRLFPPY